MLQAYLVILTQVENSVIAEFPDVPEVLTQGRDIKNALAWAEDALIVALSGYIDDKRDIPILSRIKKGQFSVILPPLVATKLAIYQAMQDKHIAQVELAKHLNCDHRQIKRILDLDHHSTLEQLDNALYTLDKRLVVDIQDYKVTPSIKGSNRVTL